MFDKLREIESRFEMITADLSDPAVISDRGRFGKLAKERAQLEPLVETFRAHQRVARHIEENEALLADADADVRALAREELPALKAELAAFEERLKILLLPKDPNDEKNVILEIRAGTGGEEAALFAAELFRVYARYAERRRWKMELLDRSDTGLGGVREVIASISGDGVYSALRYESGVHRVQRVPETEAQGRIHTSTATVAVLPEADEVDVRIDDRDLRIDVMRAGGPGGQSVNTTDSAVRITHLPTNMVVQCQDEKSQHKNKAKALKILRARLLEAERERQEKERVAARRAQVKSGDRSDKIRTYNFPQDRLTDHRIGLTRHNLAAVMDGDIEDVIGACRSFFQAEALKESVAQA
jgi:peptide chain release factor 1